MALIAHVVVGSLQPQARARLGPIRRLILWPTLMMAKLVWGGLWVGGDLYLESDIIRFEPNALNAALHHGDLRWDVPLGGIQEVNVRKATVTDIIDIVHDKGVHSVRCYGATEFAERVNSALVAIKSG